MEIAKASYWFNQVAQRHPSILIERPDVVRINEHTVFFTQTAVTDSRLAVAYFLPPIPGTGTFSEIIEQLEHEIVSRGVGAKVEIDWTISETSLNVFVGAHMSDEPANYEQITELISLATDEGISIATALLDLVRN